MKRFKNILITPVSCLWRVRKTKYKVAVRQYFRDSRHKALLTVAQSCLKAYQPMVKVSCQRKERFTEERNKINDLYKLEPIGTRGTRVTRIMQYLQNIVLLAVVFIPISPCYKGLMLLLSQAVLPSNLKCLCRSNAVLVPQHLTLQYFFKSDTVCLLCYISLLPLMLFPHQSLQMSSKTHPNLNFKSRCFFKFYLL